MVKILTKGDAGEPYLVEWKTGYVQVWEDWSQYFHPRKYNWLNFRPIWFEIDYDKLAGEHLSIELGLLGFNLRFHQFIRENEAGKKIDKELTKLRTIDEDHQKEIEKLKNKIKELKSKKFQLGD